MSYKHIETNWSLCEVETIDGEMGL